MKWWIRGILLVALAALAAVAAQPAQSTNAWILLNENNCNPNAYGPAVRAISSDTSYVYAARMDGRVSAHVWDAHREGWTTDFRPLYTPRIRVWDLIAEPALPVAGGRLYVALLDDSATTGPAMMGAVVALNKADGSIAWRTDQAWGARQLPGDPMTLAMDDSFLYVGTKGGHLFKINRADGTPVLQGGQLLQYTSPTHPQGHPKEITTIAIDGTRLWAALNYGGVPAFERENAEAAGRDPIAFPRLDTSINNRIAVLNTATLDFDDGVDQPLSVAETTFPPGNGLFDEQAPRALPAIMSIWPDPNSGNLFMGGIGITKEEDNRSFSIVFRFSKNDVGSPNGVNGQRNLMTPLALRIFRIVTDGEPGTPMAGGVTKLAGDGTNLFVTNLVNRTDGGGEGIMAPLQRANIYRLNPTTLEDTGWVRQQEDGDGQVYDAGRRFEAGNADALYIEPTPPNRMFVGHECQAGSAYSWLRSESAGTDNHVQDGNDVYGEIPQPLGALLIEVPRDTTTPTGILMYPASTDVTNGVYPVGFRIDLPTDEAAAAPRFNADFFVRDESEPNPVWWRMEGLKLSSFEANDYYFSHNVVLTWKRGTTITPLPEGSDYRLRVDIRSLNNQLLFSDVGEHTFVVDRTAPTIQLLSPTDSLHTTNNRLKIQVQTSDALSDVSSGVMGSGVYIDNTPWPCLDFVTDTNPDPALRRVTGYELDLAKSTQGNEYKGCSNRQPLSDGFHVIRAESMDRARNFAFVQVRIYVDTSVRAPDFTPTSNGWTNEPRPTLVGQFYESITVKQAYLDGADVLNRLSVQPPQPGVNPLGTRVTFRPDRDLLSGAPHAWELWVEDGYGNKGGPYTLTLRIDTEQPTFTTPTPLPGALVRDARPQIQLKYADTASGLQPSSLEVFLDGFDQSRVATQTNDGFTLRPLSGLAGGRHAIEARVRDTAGNVGVHTWTFNLDLTDPTLEVRAEYPNQQLAVRKGDEIRFRVKALDDGGIKDVSLEVAPLNTRLVGKTPAQPLADDPSVYELAVKVEEARTRTVLIRAFATDSGGHVGVSELKVIVDNTAPIAFMRDLPPYVGATFKLEWTNDPPDSGSGVAYYRVEEQIGDGAWTTLFPKINGTTVDLGFAQGQPSVLRYRVTAFDHAGNKQQSASNVVETTARGDPFQNVFIPERLEVGRPYTITATMAQGAKQENITAVARLFGLGGSTVDLPMELVGGVWSLTTNLNDVAPGEYTLRLHLTDANGLELVSQSHPVIIHPEAPIVVQEVKDSPGAPVALLLAALGLMLGRRRRGDGSHSLKSPPPIKGETGACAP